MAGRWARFPQDSPETRASQLDAILPPQGPRIIYQCPGTFFVCVLWTKGVMEALLAFSGDKVGTLLSVL